MDEIKYCPHCGAIFAVGSPPEGYQGEWCCGTRDVQWAPAFYILRAHGLERVARELRKLRRQIEDRLRKDPDFLTEVIKIFRS